MKHDPKRFNPKIFISPDHLNRQHPAIQVTIEEELEGKIPFLDVLVESMALVYGRQCSGRRRTQIATSTSSAITIRGSYQEWSNA